MANDLIITGAKIHILAPYIDPAKCALYGSALEASRAMGELNTGLRVSHFMAQCAHETWGFRHLTESLFYTDATHLLHTFPHEIKSMADAAKLIAQGPGAIANRVYADRMGNGDEESGDGYKYRGRGFIGLTGKYEYRHVGQMIGMDLVDHPELLEDPVQAALAAAKYWLAEGCNSPADEDNCAGVTGKINPAMEGLADRQAWLVNCKKLWL